MVAKTEIDLSRDTQPLGAAGSLCVAERAVFTIVQACDDPAHGESGLKCWGRGNGIGDVALPVAATAAIVGDQINLEIAGRLPPQTPTDAAIVAPPAPSTVIVFRTIPRVSVL